MELPTRRLVTVTLCMLTASATLLFAEEMGTAITYQGQLRHDGVPVDDTVDLRFSLWDAATGGAQVSSPVTVNGCTVVDGVFTAEIEFDEQAFGGDACWVQVAVQGSSDSQFATLSPRQRVNPTPYALHAATAQGGWGQGTTGHLPKFTSPASFGDSVLREDAADGEVGLGVNPASALLHIHKAADGLEQHGHIRLTNSLTGTGVGEGIEMSYWTTNSTNAFLTNWEEGWFSFGTGGGVERMRILREGDVGIGTSNPDARLDVEGGSIAQLDSGPSDAFGKQSVFAQEGTLGAAGRFTASIPRSLYQPWSYDNFVFKVEAFVSLDMNSSWPHSNRGAAYSMALVYKQRGNGLANFTELLSEDYDATITFNYSSPETDSLRIDVDTNRAAGTAYKLVVKISH